MNAAIGTSEAIEENQKTVNEIYLATIGKDVDSFAPEQASALFDIANQCPMIRGNAVYEARSLYALIDDTQEFDDVLLCLPYGIVVKSLHEQADITVSIIPNPASDEATFIFAGTVQVVGIMVLYDALGGEVLRHAIPEDVERYTFSTANAAPGLYQYKIIVDGRIMGNGKLTIIR